MDGDQIYRRMLLIRECEERIRKEYSTDEIKTPTHLGIGAEAISVGIVSKLPRNTQYFGTYRNHALYLACGGNLHEFWAELYGKVTGCGKGKAGSMHLSDPANGLILTSAVVGTTIPVAVGAALRNKYLGNDDTVAVFFGDGATEEGVFHEALNFASLHRLKILFICEDNDLAIHNPSKQRQAYTLRELVKSYNIDYRYCAQGWNIDEVRHATTLSMKYLPHGPSFIHAKYYRFLEHVGPNEDYAAGYRSKPEDVGMMDPLIYLEKSETIKSVDKETREAIEESVIEDIDIAVSNAKFADFPKEKELYTDVYEST